MVQLLEFVTGVLPLNITLEFQEQEFLLSWNTKQACYDACVRKGNDIEFYGSIDTDFTQPYQAMVDMVAFLSREGGHDLY